MDFLNALRGLKKSHSGPNLSFSERISLTRRSANHGKQHRDGLSSPLPPRPPSRNGATVTGGSSNNKNGSGRMIEKIPENRVVDARIGPGSASAYVTPQELRIQGRSHETSIAGAGGLGRRLAPDIRHVPYPTVPGAVQVPGTMFKQGVSINSMSKVN